MTWLLLHDGFAQDRRVEGLSNAGHRLFVDSLLYSAQQHSDGHIDSRWVKQQIRPRDREKRVDELVRAGLWRPADRGFVAVPLTDDADKLAWHKTREEQARDAARKRTERAREPESESLDPESEATKWQPDGQPNGSQMASQLASKSPVSGSRERSVLGKERSGKGEVELYMSRNSESDAWGISDEERRKDGGVGLLNGHRRAA